MIRAEVALLKAAFRHSKDFERFALISEDSLPVFSAEALEPLLRTEKAEFIELLEFPHDSSRFGVLNDEAEREALFGRDVPWRFENYVFYDNPIANHRDGRWTFIAEGVSPDRANYLKAVAKELEREIAAKLPRRPRLFERHFGGRQWWALSRRVIDLISEDIDDRVYQEFFKYMPVADEHFFHCLVGRRARRLKDEGRWFAGTTMFHDSVRRSQGLDYLELENLLSAAARSPDGRLPYAFGRKFRPEKTKELAELVQNGTFLKALVK
jgi:hypothetical protein